MSSRFNRKLLNYVLPLLNCAACFNAGYDEIACLPKLNIFAKLFVYPKKNLKILV